jgi:hypothetical protein
VLSVQVSQFFRVQKLHFCHPEIFSNESILTENKFSKKVPDFSQIFSSKTPGQTTKSIRRQAKKLGLMHQIEHIAPLLANINFLDALSPLNSMFVNGARC